MKPLCFIFFLFYQILSDEPKYDMTVVLQSYSVENIGRSSRNYILGQIATHFTPTYNKNWKIFSNKTGSILFTRPFWLHFIDNNFHYLPFRFISANYSNFLDFSPSSLFIEGLHLFFMKNIQFKIKNTMKEDILIISEVTTFSREVFSTEFEEIKVGPQSECILNLYICPLRSGTFSTVVLISTNKGTIPYSLTYRTATLPVDSFISTIFHQSSSMPANITVKVPVALQSKKVAVFYDSSILTPDQQTQTSMSYKFTVEKLNPGFYISFLNFFSPTIGRNYPIFLSVSSKLLQSYYPVILFNTITSQSETLEVEVKMVNPTNMMIHIISVHLSSESPSNVRIIHTKPPLDCESQSITLVGKIIMTGSRLGEVNTMVIVMYEVDGYGVQSVEVPVKGYVSIGSFKLPEEKIEIVGLIEKTYKFHFFNTFKEAAFVLAAHIESDCFSIENFEVFIVNPNETSRDIIIRFNPQKINSDSNSIFDSNRVDSVLYIETNITRIIVPISGYNGNVSFSKSGTTTLAPHEGNKISFNYSSVLINSEKDISFYITNPNPTNFLVNVQSNTSLVTLLSPSTITLSNFSTQKIRLRLKFNAPLNIQPNIHSNFYFYLGSSRFDIDINWTPFSGEFLLRSSVYKIVFGLKQNISIGLKSTYRIPVQVKQIECSIGLLVKDRNLLIEPDNDYEIHRLEFTFDSTFLSKFKDPLNSSEILELPIEFTFSMNDGFMAKSYLPIKYEYAYFPNKSYAFGLIPAHARSGGNFSVVNFFDVPVIFTLKISEDIEKVFLLKSEKTKIIKPGGLFHLDFTFTPEVPGHTVLVVSVETNVTVQPFYIELDSEAIEPIFYFVNLRQVNKDQISTEKVENDKMVDKYSVSLEKSEPIEFSVFLKNDGSISIPIEKLNANSKVKIKSKCGRSLPINSRCEIGFTINPKVFTRSINHAVLQVVSCNIVKKVNITVLIDDKTVFHIKMEKFAKCVFVVFVSLLPISLRLIEVSSKKKRIDREFRWRADQINDEIERLSVSKRSSVSIQTSTPEKKPFVGRWTCPDLFKICPVSKNGIEAMSRLIGNVK